MSTTLAASSPVAPPVTFRRDDAGPAFPLGGAVLLLALLAVAAWTWWIARRRRTPAAPGWLGAAPWAFPSGSVRGPASLRVVESTRLDGVTRLHVVEWRQHRYLLATSGTAAPLIVDRDESSEQPVRTAP